MNEKKGIFLLLSKDGKGFVGIFYRLFHHSANPILVAETLLIEVKLCPSSN